MIEVGKKDKIFVAVVLPLVLIGGYLYCWRVPEKRRLSALENEYRQLPDPDSFPVEKRNLLSRIDEAEKTLAAVKAEAPVASTVDGDAQTAVADRLDQVLALFAAADIRIVRVDEPNVNEPEQSNGQASRGAATLESTGLRPTPAVRTFHLEAGYPAFLSVLKEFACRKMPVVPERISLRAGDRVCEWEMTLWL